MKVGSFFSVVYNKQVIGLLLGWMIKHGSRHKL